MWPRWCSGRRRASLPPDFRPPRVAVWPRWCSGRRRARPPARLGVLTSFGAAPRSPPVPSGPSGALHTCGAWLLTCGWVRRLEARPGPAGQAAASNRAGLGMCARPCPPVPPAPSTPVGPGRWCVAGCVVSKPFLALPSLTVARCRRYVASPDCVCFASLHARSLMSHVIPLRLFQDLNCDRWYFNVSGCCCGVGPIELRAILLRNRHIGTCWCRRSFA